MSSVVQITDFKGYHKIARNSFGDTYLQSLIDRFELYYLDLLLPIDVKQSYLLDQNQSWALPFVLEDTTICNGNISTDTVSKGFKDVLLNLVYYEIIRLTPFNSSTVGLSTPHESNSRILNAMEIERQAEQRWNDAVDSMNVICFKYDFGIKIKFKHLDLL